MEPNLLIEYRCTCGKLLFKGIMLVSVVEIKCKRCGETRIFRDNMRGIRSFMLVVDDGGKVVDACEGVAVLECSRQYVVGKLLFDILPLARDAQYQEIIPACAEIFANAKASFSAKATADRLADKSTGRSIPSEGYPVREKSLQAIEVAPQGVFSNGVYQIRNNTLLLRDRKLPLESHVVLAGNFENGAGKSGSLYRVFNVIKEV